MQGFLNGDASSSSGHLAMTGFSLIVPVGEGVTGICSVEAREAAQCLTMQGRHPTVLENNPDQSINWAELEKLWPK